MQQTSRLGSPALTVKDLNAERSGQMILFAAPSSSGCKRTARRAPAPESGISTREMSMPFLVQCSLYDQPDMSTTQPSQSMLRQQIAAELQQPEADDIRAAKLLNQLLDLDQDRIRFTVDATHLQRLGRELVTKHETALAELVKNAYDADSTVVLIVVNPIHKGSLASIQISDDGNGMTLDDIRRGWMRLSTDSKVDHPTSPLYNRRRAGRKGIGRFAVERLGRELELKTMPRGEKRGYRIKFKWDEAFTRGQELGLIFHTIEEFDKRPDEHGTQLKIVDLRDKWTDASIRATWKMLFQLQSPVVPQSRLPQQAPTLKDPGFEVFIDSQNAKGARVALSLDEEFASLALAEISGVLSADGTATFSVKSSKIDLEDSETFERPELAGLGPVDLSAHYLVFDNKSMPAAKVKSAAAMARELAGVKLYRNGFRVAPYGEPGNDWLKLAFDMGRRAILIPASNNNFVGRVHITTEGNPGLEETASREGVLEGPTYDQLVAFAHDCLWWGAKRVGSARDKKLHAGQRAFVSARSTSLHSTIAAQAEKVREAKSQVEVDVAIDKILNIATEYEERVEKQRDASIKYEAMLRILASLGLSIAVFSHEVAGSTALLNASIANLLDRIDHLNDPLRSQLEEGVSDVLGSIQRISDLGGYLGSLTTQSESRNLRTLVVRTVCDTFEKQFKEYVQGIGINLQISEIDPSLRTAPMHRSEFDSMLFNFLSNSIKAIKRARKSSPAIKLTAEAEGRHIVIRFHDTGDGVKDEYKDRIFDAFFTTSGSDKGEEEGSGTGLGLRIVSDIANSYGGSVALAPPDIGFATAFELRLPRFDPAKHAL